jgi:beta-fructofuranosidase
VDWELVGELAHGAEDQGRGWECPNYFPLGDKYVLVVSPFDPVIYAVGDFDGKQHHADRWYRLDHGKPFYATNTYIDDQRRRILVGWVRAKGDGWNGCLSLPRHLELGDDNRLRISPVIELKKLRGAHRHFERELQTITENAGTAPLFGRQLEIKARYELQQADAIGFSFIDDEGQHDLVYGFDSNSMVFGKHQAMLQFVQSDEPIELHIFVDHAVIEIYINQREVFTTTFYPKLAGNHTLKISPFIKNGVGRFFLDVWKLETATMTGQV